jgi:hypothetical protein
LIARGTPSASAVSKRLFALSALRTWRLTLGQAQEVAEG